MIAKKDHTGKLTYFHNDHLGSTQVVTDTSGNLVENTSYDPWGEIAQGGTQSKFLYTGQENDPETNLHYYNARYHDPHIRRFTQPDDIIQNIYDPQSLNRYSYVRNNPIINTDPTGHYVETILDFAFISLDFKNILNDKYNPWNYAALLGDIIGAAIPFGTGVGLGIRTVEHGGDTTKAIKVYSRQQNAIPVNLSKMAIKQNKQLKYMDAEQVSSLMKNMGSKSNPPTKLTGYTDHGLTQAIQRNDGRGVQASAMLKAVKDPEYVIIQNKKGDFSFKFVTERATVILNELGKVISTWGQPRKK